MFDGHQNRSRLLDRCLVMVAFILIVLRHPLPKRDAGAVALGVADHKPALPEEVHHVPLESDEGFRLFVDANLVQGDRVGCWQKALLGQASDVSPAVVADQPCANGFDELSEGFGLLNHAAPF